MCSYRVIAFTAALAVLSPFGVASAQPPQAAEQRQQAAEQRQQADERRREMEQRQAEERRQEAERRREMEQRQGEERRQDAEHRQDSERRQDAERRQDTDRRQDGVARAMAPGLVRAEEMVGLRVVNRENNRSLGRVSGLVTGESGQIEAVVIKHGGFLGFGTKLVTVPWGQLELSADGKTVVTNLDRRQVRGAPPYNRN